MIQGKTIVITGVASGIGQRMAELANSMGAEVFGIDAVEPATPVGYFIKGDLSTEAGVKAVVDALPDELDALCNVAGLSGKGGARITLAVNFFGLRQLSLSLAPKIRQSGSIVNVASIAGFGWRTETIRAKALSDSEGFADLDALIKAHNIPDEAGYPISKEALLVWTMLAAHQSVFKSRSIRVNAVSPGPVETPILQQFREVLGDERVNSDIDRVGRPGRAQDIAPVALFLCSDMARWVNGANVPVDGGLEASVAADAHELN